MRTSLRPFRFGVVLAARATTRQDWLARCREAEQLGYDVILVPDHLETQSPVPALLAAAEATTRPRLGTFVLNTGFWSPALLARELRTVHRYLGDRLEVGLGAGYVRAEFEAAGVRWQPAAQRIEHLGRTVAALEESFRQLDKGQPGRGGPAIMIGGNADAVLRIAARHADIASFTPGKPKAAPGQRRLTSAADLAGRVDFLRAQAAERAAAIEMNVFVQAVTITDDRHHAARRLQELDPTYSPQELLELPTVLVGSREEIVSQLRNWRQRLGFSYITVRESAMRDMAAAMELARAFA